MRNWFVALLILSAAIDGSSLAHAHLMDANKATLSIKETNAYLTMSVPVSALSGFDDNGDQLIDAIELGRHASELRNQMDGRVRMTADGATALESITFLLSPLTADHAEATADYLIAMVAMRFEKTPNLVEVWTDLFGSNVKDQHLDISAERDAFHDTAVLSPDRPSYQFFRRNDTASR
jgi:hypothetical protein